MKTESLSGANVLVIEPNTELRDTLCEGLRTYGMANARAVTSVSQMAAIAVDSLVDLIICDSDRDKDNFTRSVRSLRQGKLGPNPYVIVVATTSSPTESNFRSLVDAGIDAVLVKPLSVAVMTDRINILSRNRKSFAVTPHYIGPDRRIIPRPEESLPLLKVPNILQERLAGTFNENRIIADIAETNAAVNKQRTRQNATLIKQIIDQIVPHFESQETNDGVLIHLNQLARAANDSAQRASGGHDDHLSDLYASLIPVTQRLLETHRTADPKDIALLKDLGAAIFMAFGIDDKTRQMSKQIAKSIKGAKRFSAAGGG